MRIVFMGTPPFAVASLEEIARTGHSIVEVVTQPDRRAGRGLHIHPPAVKKWAERHGLNVAQPESLRDLNFIDRLASLKPDLLVVVAFRILPPEVLSVPAWGAINLHASLLPRYRGAAPIQWAIACGDAETGVTVFKIEEKVDTGKIIGQQRTAIAPNETAGELHDRLMALGARLLADSIGRISAGTVRLLPQDPSQVTLAPKLRRDDGEIDWRRPAADLYNRIRGFSPFPGSHTWTQAGKRIEIVRARPVPVDHGAAPGSILESGKTLVVAAGRDGLEILDVQPEYKKVMSAADFLAGAPEAATGHMLGRPSA